MSSSNFSVQASDEPMRNADHCPACGGSGHSMMLVGGGPDAQEQFADCVYCVGTGGLLDAYNSTRDLLAAEKQKNIELTCRLALVDEPKQAPRATADVERDEVLEDAAKLRDAKFEARRASGHPREASAARALAREIRELKSATKGAKP